MKTFLLYRIEAFPNSQNAERASHSVDGSMYQLNPLVIIAKKVNRQQVTIQQSISGFNFCYQLDWIGLD